MEQGRRGREAVLEAQGPLFLVASLTSGLWTRRTSGQVSALLAFGNICFLRFMQSLSACPSVSHHKQSAWVLRYIKNDMIHCSQKLWLCWGVLLLRTCCVPPLTILFRDVSALRLPFTPYPYPESLSFLH